MRLHRTLLVGTALIALLAAGACSTNRQGDDAAPSFLTLSYDLLPLDQNVNCGCFLQFSTATVANVLKTPNAGTGPFLDVAVDEYVVHWTRVDGGRTASADERFPGNVIVPAGSSSTWTNYPFMTSTRLLQPPLDQLFPFNGGVDRETGNLIIRQAGHVTLYGHNLAGQAVKGEAPPFDMNFYYAAAARPGASAVSSSLGLKPLSGRR